MAGSSTLPAPQPAVVVQLSTAFPAAANVCVRFADPTSASPTEPWAPRTRLRARLIEVAPAVRSH